MAHEKTTLEMLYNLLLDEIDAGVHAIDSSGKTFIYNQKMADIESMDRQDVLNKNLLEVFQFSEDEDSTLVCALRNGLESRNMKQSYFNNKGNEITTINNTFPLKHNGEILGAVEIAKDVTKIERLIRDNMEKKENTKYTFDHIIGQSIEMKEVIEHAKRSTRTTSSVLIIGETGTGKEIFAQSIHNGSIRSSKPFISQNCAALPDNLIESLLFGTKKGAFTGALERPGLFEQAEGGTLLLDEINSLSPNLQAKLLRAIQEKSIRRIGGTKDIATDVRIIATINEDPIDAIKNNKLRKDLYYRLSVVSLFISPLRERKEDIPLLVQHFITKYNTLFQMNVQSLSEEVYQLFTQYNWPGNVRELEHIVEGAMNFITHEQTIDDSHLPLHFRKRTQFMEDTSQPINKEKINIPPVDKHLPLKQYLANIEKAYIEKVLAKHQNNISHTATELGLSRQSLQYHLKKHSIRRSI
ncbi:sigma-54 interaction domain-containing protein [Bacillus solimangrovi]|uniref:Sigma-54-dependent Fis family transcriptional regulator n=1 Tax=Bacillus solimangrovi TaxID=1305675 RepID=A0A1E5LJN9_9BACI|nr:sigma 54-interacting transcriptional regulator [Bacillus solimangrovi]OEH94312.1 sigma-54-dependent Fis family transcriptional regulator [Bacillus solimangrovi]